jgi:hypothetical protein
VSVDARRRRAAAGGPRAGGAGRAGSSHRSPSRADEHIDVIVAEGAIDAVVPLLSQAATLTENARNSPVK